MHGSQLGYHAPDGTFVPVILPASMEVHQRMLASAELYGACLEAFGLICHGGSLAKVYARLQHALQLAGHKSQGSPTSTSAGAASDLSAPEETPDLLAEINDLRRELIGRSEADVDQMLRFYEQAAAACSERLGRGSKR